MVMLSMAYVTLKNNNFMYIRFGNNCYSVNVMDLAQSQSHNNKIVSLNNAITLFYKYAP